MIRVNSYLGNQIRFFCGIALKNLLLTPWVDQTQTAQHNKCFVLNWFIMWRHIQCEKIKYYCTTGSNVFYCLLSCRVCVWVSVCKPVPLYLLMFCILWLRWRNSHHMINLSFSWFPWRPEVDRQFALFSYCTWLSWIQRHIISGFILYALEVK